MKHCLCAILLALCCANAFSQQATDCSELKSRIRSILERIDTASVDSGDRGILTILNNDISNLLIQNLSILGSKNCNVNRRGVFNHLIATDDKTGIVSWDTGMGGTMKDYRTLMFFSTGQSWFSKSWEGDVYFDTLLVVNGSKETRPVYLVYGSTQISTADHLKRLKAFSISTSDIAEIPIFPGATSFIEIEYDRRHFKNDDKEVDIVFKKGGKELLIPVVEDGVFTGHYYTLSFKEGFFIKQH